MKFFGKKRGDIFYSLLVVISCLIIILIGTPAISQNHLVDQTSTEIASITTKKPDISTHDLELLVKPLTTEELEEEAKAWLTLLKSKVEQISNVEIVINQKNQEIDNLSVDNPPLELEEVKQQLINQSIKLQMGRVEIIERLIIVLDEWSLKGGEVEKYEQYIKAVSGVDIDITDADDIWLRFSAWLRSESGGITWGLNIARVLFIIIFWLVIGWIINRFYDTAHKKYLTSGGVRK